MNLSDFRAKYPQYDDLSDDELARGLHQKFYSDMPFEEFSSKIGVKRDGFIDSVTGKLKGAQSALISTWEEIHGETPEAAQATAKEIVNQPGGFVASAMNAAGATLAGGGRMAHEYGIADKDNALTQTGQRMMKENPTLVHGFEDFAKSPITGTMEAVGNAAGSMVPAVGAGLVGTAVTAGAAAAGVPAALAAAGGAAVSFLGGMTIAALPSYESIRSKQILNDPAAEENAKDVFVATLGAAAVGAIERMFGPQQWAAALMTKEGRAQVAEKFAAASVEGAVLKGGVKGAVVEGAEELAQNPIEQLASYENPLTPENLKDTAFSGFMGAVGGGIVGGGVGGFSKAVDPTKADVLGKEMDAIQSGREFVADADQIASERLNAENAQIERVPVEASEVLGEVTPEETIENVASQPTVDDAILAMKVTTGGIVGSAMPAAPQTAFAQAEPQAAAPAPAQLPPVGLQAAAPDLTVGEKAPDLGTTIQSAYGAPQPVSTGQSLVVNGRDYGDVKALPDKQLEALANLSRGENQKLAKAEIEARKTANAGLQTTGVAPAPRGAVQTGSAPNGVQVPAAPVSQGAQERVAVSQQQVSGDPLASRAVQAYKPGPEGEAGKDFIPPEMAGDAAKLQVAQFAKREKGETKEVYLGRLDGLWKKVNLQWREADRQLKEVSRKHFDHLYNKDGDSPYQKDFVALTNKVETLKNLSAEFGNKIDDIEQQEDSPPAVASRNPQVDTPEFKQWFRKSKAVDETGAPLVAYHGTTRDITKFNTGANLPRGYLYQGDLGTWFAAPSRGDGIESATKVASGFAKSQDSPFRQPSTDGGVVYPVFLSIQNPLEFASYEEFAQAVDEAEIDGKATAQKWKQQLIKQGYDGIVIRDSMTDGGERRDDWVAFKDTQIKSAVGNNGDFSRRDGNILASRSPATGVSQKVMNEVPGIMRAAKNLTERERQKLRSDTAVRFVEIFDQLPSTAEMASVALAGKAKRGWYRKSAKAIAHVFGPDAPRFAALLAALSPQTSVETNLKNALATWKNWTAAGRPTDEAQIKRIIGASVQGKGTEESVLEAWEDNSLRALTAEDPQSVVLSGPKVNSFYQNLIGNVNEVTNDAWMANYALVNQKIFGGKLTKDGDPGKSSGYLAMSAKVREAADALTKMTGETWTPAEVQETIWSWAKTVYEAAAAEGETRSARELVRSGAITDDLINSTPDFRTLFNEGTYQAILREAGLGDRLNDLAAQVDNEGTGAQVTRAGRQAAPSPRLVERAAQRLDELKLIRDLDAEYEAAKKAAEGVTGTKNFKRWFRQSKVVDEEGRPMVVFHFTQAKQDFSAFNTKLSELGSHFGTKEQAEGVNADATTVEDIDGGRTILAYLSIQKPLRLKDYGWFDAATVAPQLVDLGIIDERQMDMFRRAEMAGGRAAGTKMMQLAIKDAGYDGVVYLNRRENVSTVEEDNNLSDEQFSEKYPEARDSYIAFEPTQIKSAIGNTGKFDRKNPDMLKSERRAPGETRERHRELANRARELSRAWRGQPVFVHRDGDDIFGPTAEDTARLKEWFASGAAGRVEAFYDPNTKAIHVITSNIESMERLEFVLASHEVFHSGLRKLIGEDLIAPILTDIYEKNARVKAAVEARVKENKRLNVTEELVTTIEEVLADMPDKPSLKGWDALVRAIRSWLAKWGMIEWTDEQVEAFVAASRATVRDGLKSPFVVTAQDEMTVRARMNEAYREFERTRTAPERMVGDKKAGWSRGRLQNELDTDTGSTFKGDTKSVVFRITPEQFLDLTSVSPDSIRMESEKLDVERLRGESQSPVLSIEPNYNDRYGVGNGKGWRVTGHEGRHRMAAMEAEGITDVPVKVVFRDRGWTAPEDMPTEIELWGQSFGDRTSKAYSKPITLKDGIPLSVDRDGELRQSMSGADLRFSVMRDQSEPAPLWYSNLAKQVEASKMNVMPPKQWIAFINSAMSKGIKADEIEWSGIKDWLNMLDSYNRYLKASVRESNTEPGRYFIMYEDGATDPNSGLGSKESTEQLLEFARKQARPKVSKGEILAYLSTSGIKVEERILAAPKSDGPSEDDLSRIKEMKAEIERLQRIADEKDWEANDLTKKLAALGFSDEYELLQRKWEWNWNKLDEATQEVLLKATLDSAEDTLQGWELDLGRAKAALKILYDVENATKIESLREERNQVELYRDNIRNSSIPEIQYQIHKMKSRGAEIADPRKYRPGESSWTLKDLTDYIELAMWVPNTNMQTWNMHDSSHFEDYGEGRTVAWIRGGTLMSADGKRYFVADEIQSKRAERGRDLGWRENRGPFPEPMPERRTELPEGFKVVEGLPIDRLMQQIRYAKLEEKRVVDLLTDEQQGVLDEELPERITDGFYSWLGQSPRISQDIAPLGLYVSERDWNQLLDVLRRYVPDAFEGLSPFDNGKTVYKVKKGSITFGIADTKELAIKDALGRLHIEEVAEWNSRKQEWSRSDNKVPPGPFVTKTELWSKLAIRRAMRYAADNGYDGFAWTPGWMQAARYGIGRIVTKAWWRRYENGNGRFDAELNNGSTATFEYNPEGIVIDVRNHAPQEALDKHLSESIGKELAARVVAEDEGIVGPDAIAVLGGGGMKRYYDEMVPTYVNQIIRKVDPDAKVETQYLAAARNGNGNESVLPYGYTLQREGDLWTIREDGIDGAESDIVMAEESREEVLAAFWNYRAAADERTAGEISYEIIAAGEEEGGFNLYTPQYGGEFAGNFETYEEAEAAGRRLVSARSTETYKMQSVTFSEKVKEEARKAQPLMSQRRPGLGDLAGQLTAAAKQSQKRDLADSAVKATRPYARVQKFLLALASDRDSFQFGTSNKRDWEGIAKDMGLMAGQKTGDVEGEITKIEKKHGNIEITLRATRQKTIQWDSSTGPESTSVEDVPMVAKVKFGAEKRDWQGDEGIRPAVYVDTSDLRTGSGGKQVYQLIYTWAANNGVLFAGDPNSVSPKAIEARLSHMISAAARLGTTMFMWPVDPQLLNETYGWQEPKWFKKLWNNWRDPDMAGDENDEHNMRLLIESAIENAEHKLKFGNGFQKRSKDAFIDPATGRVAKLEDFEYNFKSDKFVYRDDGAEVPQQTLDAIATRLLPVGTKVPAGGRAGAGPGTGRNGRDGSRTDVPQEGFAASGGAGATAARAVVLKSLYELSPQDVARLSEAIARGDRPVKGTALAGLLYSRGRTTQALSRSGPLDTAARKLGGELLAEKVTKPLYNRLLDLGKYVPEKVKAGMVSDYGLPEPYIDRRDLMQIGQRKGLKKAEKTVELLMGLDRAQSRVAYQWMNQRDAEGDRLLEQLPPDEQQVLRELKSFITQLGAEAVELGQLTEEAFLRNKDAYLHRSYRKYEMDETKQQAFARARAIKIFGEQYRGRGLRDNIEREKLEAAILSRGEAATGERGGVRLQVGPGIQKGDKFIRLERRTEVTDREVERGATPGSTRLRDVRYVPEGEPIPAKYAGYTVDGVWEARYMSDKNIGLWRDFTPEERERMGELDEVKFATAQTLMLMTRDIEVGRFLKWVADNYAKDTEDGLNVVDTPTGWHMSTFDKDTWVRVPETVIPKTGGVKVYGNLAGKYVPAAMWNDVRQVSSARFNPLGDFYAGALRAWKLSKTALSPAVHMNNVMANVVLADLADVGVADIYRSLKTLYDAKRGDEDAKALIERYDASGGEIGNFALRELREDVMGPLLEELRREIENQNEGSIVAASSIVHSLMHGQFREAYEKLLGKAPVRVTKKVAELMIRTYQNEDMVFRLAAWIKGTNEGMEDIEAGKIARKEFLDYNINAPWVQNARATVFPFAAFSYRAVPLLLESIANKPWKLAKYWAIAAALNAAAYALVGGDEDDERKLLPEEKSGKIWGIFPRLVRMPWNDKNGSPVFMDVRRWVPVGDFWDTTQNQSAVPTPQFLIPGGPLALVAEFISNKSNFTGKPITLETNTKWENAAAVADHIWKFYAPNLPFVPGSYSYTSIMDAGKGVTDAFGRERSVGQALASSVGVKVASYPEDQLLKNLKGKLTRDMYELDTEFAKKRRQFAMKGMSEAEFEKEANKYAEKKMKLRTEFAEKVGGQQVE